jgi:hypothetical protein
MQGFQYGYLRAMDAITDTQGLAIEINQDGKKLCAYI